MGFIKIEKDDKEKDNFFDEKLELEKIAYEARTKELKEDEEDRRRAWEKAHSQKECKDE